MKIQLNPGGNLTYQDYASDIWEILAYNRLNLNSPDYTILNWIAVLVEHRLFSIKTPVARRAKRYLIDNFGINVNGRISVGIALVAVFLKLLFIGTRSIEGIQRYLGDVHLIAHAF